MTKLCQLFNRNFLPLLILTMFLLAPGYAHAVKIEAMGIRGGVNFKYVAIPPAEDHDFYKADVFMVFSLPWHWQHSSGWDMSWRITSAAGILRGEGDTAFIAELGPGIAFRKPDSKVIVDIGTGLAALTRHRFGGQDMGGPVQIVGHGGIGYELTPNLVIGWRFHHISDAKMYGGRTKGVDMNLLELRRQF